MRRIVMVTGLQAAGKTTVGRLLAERLPAPSAGFDGDMLYNMVAAGGADMTPSPTEEALRQVPLRYGAAALIAQHYARNGFDFVYSDIVPGPYVREWMDSIHGAERHLVVLTPSVDAIVAREIARGKNTYRDWREPGDSLADAVMKMSGALDQTPRRGLWLDTSDETATHTVDWILADDMRASLY